MALGHEEGQPIGILLEDEIDRLAAVGTHLPLPQIAARQLLPTGVPLLLGRLEIRSSNGTSWVFAWRPATLCTSEEPVARLASPCPVSDLWSASAFLPIRLLPLRGRP